MNPLGRLALTAGLTIEISGMRALGPKGYMKTIVFSPPGSRLTKVEVEGPFTLRWSGSQATSYLLAVRVLPRAEDEAKELYLGYSVPGAGEPLFQAASANINPWSEAKVDSTNPERGPMLIVSADSDQTVPWAIANAAYKKQKHNKGVTEIVKMPGRGHALTIDAGWREVAEKALEFVKRFA